jgi:hypothetical protein
MTRGYRLGLTLILVDAGLSKEEREYLYRAALELYFREETSIEAACGTFVGRVYTDGEAETIGRFSGVVYNIEGSNSRGEVRVRLLFLEQTGLSSKVAEA